MQSHFHVKPNHCVEVRLMLGWGFDNDVSRLIHRSFKEIFLCVSKVKLVQLELGRLGF